MRHGGAPRAPSAWREVAQLREVDRAPRASGARATRFTAFVHSGSILPDETERSLDPHARTRRVRLQLWRRHFREKSSRIVFQLQTLHDMHPSLP